MTFLSSPQLVAVYSGPVSELPYRGRPLRSAIAKTPQLSPVAISRDGLAGDAQADHRYHGGPDQAVCVYAREHYEHWASLLGREIPACSFGENLLTVGLAEADICVGDQIALADAVLEVSAPRTPCFKPGVRARSTRLKQAMKDTGRVGFYARVLEPGTVEAGSSFGLLERPFPELSIAAVYASRRDRDPAGMHAALAAPQLAARFRADLLARLTAVGAAV